MRLNEFVCECGNEWRDTMPSDECPECREFCLPKNDVDVNIYTGEEI